MRCSAYNMLIEIIEANITANIVFNSKMPTGASTINIRSSDISDCVSIIISFNLNGHIAVNYFLSGFYNSITFMLLIGLMCRLLKKQV